MPVRMTMPPSSEPPLFVDMDGTLLATDITWESLLATIRSRIFNLFLIPIWLFRGKVYLKDRLADGNAIEPELLPYHKNVIDFLTDEDRRGRTIILATASHEAPSRRIAEYLGLFDDVMGTRGSPNLKGERKLAAIRQYVGEGKPFDYAGDSSADLPIWAAARHAYLVGVRPAVRRQAEQRGNVARVFETAQPTARTYVRAFRSHQWLKNLLVFLPLVLAHQVGNATALVQAGIAFIVFGLAASSVYIWNDLMDLDNDRAHLRKRSRPFAAGQLPIQSGLLLAPLLVAASLMAAATFLPLRFGLVLLVYLVATTLYSHWLKRVVLVDVLVLAGLYALRILAGSAATGVPISEWLITFSIFLFFSLALAKRCAELNAIQSSDGAQAHGRSYAIGDAQFVEVLGAVAGYMAVLVMALYINGPHVKELYARPEVLWGITPLLLYWISRVWLLTHRGQLSEDPILFALRDGPSYVVGVLALLVALVATIP